MIRFNSETIIVHLGEPNALLIPVPESELPALAPAIDAGSWERHRAVEIVMLAPNNEDDPVHHVALVFASAEAQVAFLKQFDCDFRIVGNSEMGLVCNAAGAVTGTRALLN